MMPEQVALPRDACAGVKTVSVAAPQLRSAESLLDLQRNELLTVPWNQVECPSESSRRQRSDPGPKTIKRFISQE